METLARRFDAVRSRIDRAARGAGRDPATVTLVAVSKTRTPDEVRALAALGQKVFGENRVQEAVPKVREVAGSGNGLALTWRMVGHLQRNKVKAALEFADAIDSVDSIRLAEAIDRELDRRNESRPVLLEFNCSGDAAKHGFRTADLDQVAERVPGWERLSVEGLMTIGPLEGGPEAARGAFRELRELREDLARRLGRPLPELSMGMSADLEVGIEEGATLVRVGTALFGPRE